MPEQQTPVPQARTAEFSARLHRRRRHHFSSRIEKAANNQQTPTSALFSPAFVEPINRGGDRALKAKDLLSAFA